jgi:hypothetical protein
MTDGWMKIEKGRAGRKDAPRRKRPAVSRNAKSPTSAYMSIPDGYVSGERVSIFVSGTKIGFMFGEDGDFMVREADKNTKIRRITIPTSICEMIPIGLHEVDLETTDSGLLVFDCAAIVVQE